MVLKQNLMIKFTYNFNLEIIIDIPNLSESS